MATKHYYLLSALPHLGALGDESPVSSAQLLGYVAESGGPRHVIEAILLSDDLLQRDALLAGELESDSVSPVVLTSAQLSDDNPMPSYLVAEAQNPARLAADSIWEAYFRHAAATARKTRNNMLASWVGAEIAMRNALAAARAQALGLEVEAYLVAADLAGTDADFSATVNEWSTAPDPLAGLRVVDTARWAWLSDHDAWFSFNDDELAVYAARIMLLQRWRRLEKDAAQAVEV